MPLKTSSAKRERPYAHSKQSLLESGKPDSAINEAQLEAALTR